MKRGPSNPGLWPEEILLGLGSNMGDRLAHLKSGIMALNDHNRISVHSISSVFESEFVGEGNQNLYLNACIQIRTTLSPKGLLDLIKVIEEGCGRRPNSHMQPRPLDMDILLFGQRHFISDNLVVPHPRMMDRAFVLEPLAELVPGKRFPDSRETVGIVCAKLKQQNETQLMVREDLSLPNPWRDHKEE